MKGTVIVGMALLFGSVVLPQSAEGQGPFECWYCFQVSGVGVCVDQVQSTPCNEGAPPDENGCTTCSTGEEQDLDVEVALHSNGTLSAPGTVFDGVEPEWLSLIADNRDGVFMAESPCGATIALRARGVLAQAY